jgi:hypothetical protein
VAVAFCFEAFSLRELVPHLRIGSEGMLRSKTLQAAPSFPSLNVEALAKEVIKQLGANLSAQEGEDFRQGASHGRQA